jgi:hypothetical protein
LGQNPTSGGAKTMSALTPIAIEIATCPHVR